MKLLPLLVAGCIGVLSASQAVADSLVARSLPDRIASIPAICRGTVVGLESFREASGGIYTKATIQVDEALKGTFPSAVVIKYRGGTVGNTTEVQGDLLIGLGESRLWFLAPSKRGFLTLPEGSSGAVALANRSRSPSSATPGDALLVAVRRELATAPQAGGDLVSFAAKGSEGEPTGPVQTVATNLVPVGSIPSRFTAPDRGEPIRYLIDADAKPAALTVDQCVTAISNAFHAWSEVTSLSFAFDGFESFGMAPADVDIDDGRIRIALHDLYNDISGTSTLGVGGSQATFTEFTQGGEGGNVRGNEFHPTVRGYAVFKHTHGTMQNAKTFEEVACHELGHVLGMAHSSVNMNEANQALKQSIMFYLVHADGRGAQLGSYDPPVIQQAYPLGNTPPWNFPRYLHVVTASPSPTVAGINSVELRGYDLQSYALTLLVTNMTSNNGSFTRSGSTVNYVPQGAFPDSEKLTPESGQSWDHFFYRLSDGTNASPWQQVSVLSYNRDRFPSGNSDGIPDNWMITHFGNANPAVGSKHQAGDDADGDGATNFEEFLAGTDPMNAASFLRVSLDGTTALHFTTQPYDLYEPLGSVDLTTWSRATNPIQTTNTTGSVPLPPNAAPHRFYRLERVP